MIKSLIHLEWLNNLVMYLTVYHVENCMIRHHVVLHGGPRSKNADLKISLLLLQRRRRSTVWKENTCSSGGASREITCWHQAWESSAFGVGFLRLMPTSDLPPRTTRFGLFYFNIGMASWWLYEIYHDDIATNRMACCDNVLYLSAAMHMTPFIILCGPQHLGPWEMW